MRLLVFLLVWLLAAGFPVKADRPKDSASADLISGINAYNKNDFASALKFLQAAADRGEPEAMVNLGYMYARGHGVASDPAFALRLYQRAAEAGDAEGMNAVGYRYNFAHPPDLDNAIRWYCRAVLGGNPRAMNNAALLFYKGQGVSEDRGEARSLWRQAAERGSLNAQANLGVDLSSDVSLLITERLKGTQMLRDAAFQGSAFAQDILRKNGDHEAFPPATVYDLTMKLEPRDPKPGSSHLCGALIS